VAFTRKPFINTAIYFAVSVLSRAASLLLIPLYTARLTPSEYGSYGLALSILAIAPSLITLAGTSAIARFFFDSKDPKTRDSTVGALTAAVITLSLGGATIAALASHALGWQGWGGLTRHHFDILFAIGASQSIAEVPAIYYRALEDAWSYAAFAITTFATTASTTLYTMVKLGLGLEGMLIGLLAGQALGALITGYMLLTRLRPTFEPGLLRRAFGYSLPLVPHTIGNALMIGVDRWALESFGFRHELGLYTLATQLTSAVPIATNAWNEASSPNFLAAWRDRGVAGARIAFRRIVAGFVVTGGGTLLLTICAFPLLGFFVGDRFHPAFTLVPAIGLSLVIGGLFSAFINVLFYRKQTSLIPLLTLTSVVVNAALNFVFVPRWHVWGAIIATGLALAFRSAVMMLFALRGLRDEV
jgi:O-antigen/teichoic acid export membrane protein